MRPTVVAVVVIAVLTWFGLKKTAGQPANCTEFGFQISTTCCCASDCCREAKAGEFIHIDGERYRSTVTGQLVYRTGWSPDGRTIKCSCDQIAGKWTKHPHANVRCLWVPPPSS